MIPELGHFALILALLVAIVQSAFGLAGPALQRERWIAAVRPAVTMQFLLQSAALLALMFAFVSNDFSVQYVAQNSNSALPVVYRVAAVWGAHEGSLLLWGWILAAWTLAVALFSRMERIISKPLNPGSTSAVRIWRARSAIPSTTRCTSVEAAIGVMPSSLSPSSVERPRGTLPCTSNSASAWRKNPARLQYVDTLPSIGGRNFAFSDRVCPNVSIAVRPYGVPNVQ